MKRGAAIIALAVMAAPVTLVGAVTSILIFESWRIRPMVLAECQRAAVQLDDCFKPNLMLSVADSWLFGLVVLATIAMWWAAWRWLWLRKAPPARKVAGVLATLFVGLFAAATYHVFSTFNWM